MKIFLASALLFFVAVGCASVPVQPGAPPSREQLQDLAMEQSANKHVYQARFNPPLCPCPPFEVYAAGRWIRVVLVEQDEDRPIAKDLRFFASEQEDSGAKEVFLIGTLEGDRIQYSATGFPLVEFVLEGFTNSYPGGGSDLEETNREFE